MANHICLCLPLPMQLADVLGSRLHSYRQWINRWPHDDPAGRSQPFHGDGGTAHRDDWSTCIFGHPLPQPSGGTACCGTAITWSPRGELGRVVIPFSGLDGFIADKNMMTRWTNPEAHWRCGGWPSHASVGCPATAGVPTDAPSPSATSVLRFLQK